MTLECIVCGVRGPQIRPRMVEWKEPGTKRFELLPLCVNAAECRQRVEQTGEPWPFAETSNERGAA